MDNDRRALKKRREEKTVTYCVVGETRSGWSVADADETCNVLGICRPGGRRTVGNAKLCSAVLHDRVVCDTSNVEGHAAVLVIVDAGRCSGGGALVCGT